jgi:hypothetical protein
MSFFSGTTDNVPAPPQKLLGLDERLSSTAEQARPLPYFVGRRLLGVTALSEPFFVQAIEESTETKKDSVVTGYHYFAMVAFMICHGPVDKVYRIYLDKEVVWEGELTRGNEDSINIAIPNRGAIEFMWGTETQPQHPLIALSGILHTAYRGQCWCIAHLYFGKGRTSAPQLEFELGRWPSIDWFTAPINIDGDCNPFAFIAEMADDKRFGAGLPTNRLATASFNTAAQIVADEGIGISPLLTRQSTFRELLAEALQYVDGFHYYTNGGKLAVGLNRSLEESAIVTVGVDDLLAPPNVHAPSWEKTVNVVHVKYSNRARHFAPDAEPYRNSANRQIVGRSLVKTVDRSWVTKSEVAAKMALAIGRQSGLPETTGSIAIKKSVGASLTPGRQFFLCYPPTGLHLLCRSSDLQMPAPGSLRCEVQFRVDRGYLSSDTLFVPPPTSPPNPVDHTPEPVAAQAAFDLPYGVTSDSYAAHVGILARRASAITTGLKVHRKNPSGSYGLLIDPARFARHAVLQSNYGINTPLIDDEVGMLIKLEGIDKTLPVFPLEDALTNRWLIFASNELLSMFNATLVAADTYRVYVIRNRYGSARQEHFAHSKVWLVERAALTAYIESGANNPQTFKLQPFVMSAGLDLADAAPLIHQLSYAGLMPWAPLNLRAFGLLDPVYQTGQNVPVTWSDVTPDPTGFDVPDVWMEISSGFGVVVHSETIAGGVEQRLITTAEITSWLGAEVTFAIRLYHIRNGYKSRDHIDLTVTKI